MDRRQVEDVEAKLGDIGQAFDGSAKVPGLSSGAGRRAWEELVPATEARPLPVDPDALAYVAHGHRLSRLVLAHPRRQRRLEGHLTTDGLRPVLRQPFGASEQPLRV